MDTVQYVLIISDILLGGGSALHALLNKREPRSAMGWIAICLMFPFAGPFLYFLLGINRIRIRARKLETRSPFRIEREEDGTAFVRAFQIPSPLDEIARMSDAIIRRPLICGNRVEALHDGEQAYPAMLEAIEKAEEYVYLASYIFESRGIGRCFLDALDAAKKRGVRVRVIIDGVGELYSFPRAGSFLKKKGIPFARFLPPGFFPPAFRINLRNHRKILVGDGKTAFIGGMNIGDRHMAEDSGKTRRVKDIHFRLTGPIVTQIEEVFLEDWRFCSGENLKTGQVPLSMEGNTICRAIVDGPNVSIDRLYMLLICAISSARKSVSIMTPYFLPAPELTAAMQAAALRGVSVNIILPEKNNLPYVHWAAMNTVRELLEFGVCIWLQPPPFVHTKLFLIDRHYAQIGSANLDTRSLRLNFELIVEVYDRKTAGKLCRHFDRQMRKSREISLEDIDNRSFPARLRDAFFWLFTPYL
ncbi:MAG: cardiolipin synthase [Desulfococcaceae bacterium]|jgi:cardiolipin synthase|nr:cardiolipin synthase [Desulfococcaceae bacterium]